MSSSSSVYLVNVKDLSWNDLRSDILARILFYRERDARHLASYDLKALMKQLSELEASVTSATSLVALAGMCGALSTIGDLVFLRESKYACDHLMDIEGEILTKVLRDRLSHITEVQY